MKGDFILPGLAQQAVAFDAWREGLGLFPQPFRFVGKTLYECFELLETPPLEHGALLSIR
jgi:hypothetical protein